MDLDLDLSNLSCNAEMEATAALDSVLERADELHELHSGPSLMAEIARGVGAGNSINNNNNTNSNSRSNSNNNSNSNSNSRARPRPRTRTRTTSSASSASSASTQDDDHTSGTAGGSARSAGRRPMRVGRPNTSIGNTNIGSSKQSGGKPRTPGGPGSAAQQRPRLRRAAPAENGVPRANAKAQGQHIHQSRRAAAAPSPQRAGQQAHPQPLPPPATPTSVPFSLKQRMEMCIPLLSTGPIAPGLRAAGPPFMCAVCLGPAHPVGAAAGHCSVGSSAAEGSGNIERPGPGDENVDTGNLEISSRTGGKAAGRLGLGMAARSAL
jgi:hypothetical protein